jgi:peptide/nickel transport system permease protein
MAQTTLPSGDNSLLQEATQMRKIGRFERLVGPDNYRILTGLLKTPASIIGLTLIVFFIFVAIAAPVLAPPKATGDPFQIPRDGFTSDPRPPGTEWKRNKPPLPFWWKALTGKDDWIHLFGTTAGQYDIYYAMVWGTRTAFKTGLVVTIATLLIGVVIGSISA